MTDERKLDTDPRPVQRVRFNYIKSNFFRSVHVDGAFGGLSPNGNIHCSVFNERMPIPQTTDHTISEDGTVSSPTEFEGKTGIVREIDVDLVLSIPVARELIDWLNLRIKEFEVAAKRSGQS